MRKIANVPFAWRILDIEWPAHHKTIGVVYSNKSCWRPRRDLFTIRLQRVLLSPTKRARAFMGYICDVLIRAHCCCVRVVCAARVAASASVRARLRLLSGVSPSSSSAVCLRWAGGISLRRAVEQNRSRTPPHWQIVRRRRRSHRAHRHTCSANSSRNRC